MQTTEMFVKLHMESNRKDEEVSKLQSQVAALQATVESFSRDNAYLRKLNKDNEDLLQTKWFEAEVLQAMMQRIASTVQETAAALNKPDRDVNRVA